MNCFISASKHSPNQTPSTDMEASSAWVSFPIHVSEKALGKRRSRDDEDDTRSSGHGRKRESRRNPESYEFKFSRIPPSLSVDSTKEGTQREGVLHCENQGRREGQWKVEFPSRKDPSQAHVFATSLQRQSSTAGTQEVLLLWDEDSHSYRLERLAGCFNLQYDRGQSQRGLSKKAKELLNYSPSNHQPALPSKAPASPSTQAQAATTPKPRDVSVGRVNPSQAAKPDPVLPIIEHHSQQYEESPRLAEPPTDWTPPEILDWDELEARREAQSFVHKANISHSRDSSANSIQSQQQQQPPIALGLDLNLDVEGAGAISNKEFPELPATQTSKVSTSIPPLPSTPGSQHSAMPFPEIKTDSTRPKPTETRSSNVASSWKPAAISDSASHVEATQNHAWHDDDDDDESEEDSEEDEESEEGEGDGNGADDLEDFARLLEEELAGEA